LSTINFVRIVDCKQFLTTLRYTDPKLFGIQKKINELVKKDAQSVDKNGVSSERKKKARLMKDAVSKAQQHTDRDGEELFSVYLSMRP
jgi:hypothetical protein